MVHTLVFVWACERSSDFIWGKSITGETDHKPLVPMLTTDSVDQLPPRIQRLRMRFTRFNPIKTGGGRGVFHQFRGFLPNKVKVTNFQS